MIAGAFVYLAVCSIRNRIKVRLRRLGEPRYLIGFVIAVAYLGLVFARPGRAPRAGAGPAPGFDELAGLLELGGALALLAAVAIAWLLPGSGRPALTFSPADVQFLFTAPVTRRALLHYKILRSQGSGMVGSAIVTIVLRPGSLSDAWMFFAGTLAVMATLNLHLTGVSLRRESLRAHGRAGLAAVWGPAAVIAAAVLVVGVSIARHWPALVAPDSLDAFAAQAAALGASWPVRVVLFPFLALARLPLADSSASFLAALPPVLLLFAANYAWVLLSDAAFQEAAARDAEEQAARGSARARPAVARRAPPFTLRARGRPEIALLWKNLILASRYASWRIFLRLLPMLALAAFVVGNTAQSAAEGLAALAAIGAAAVVFVGPQVLRNDLRQDLAEIATLKSWPLSGAVIVRGEVLAPVVILSAIVWLLLVAAAAFWGGAAMALGIDPGPRVSWAVAGMLVAPGVIAIEIVVQNALAVLFPEWVDLGAARGRGMEVMGQRLLVAGALVVAVSIALVPAMAAAYVGAWLVHMLTAAATVAIPAAIAGVSLLIQAALVITRLGRFVDRMDVAAVPALD